MLYEKSLIELENIKFTDSNFDSYVVKTAQNAVKKPIKELNLEEIRLLISQNIGIKYLLPIALSELEKNILIEITYFEGDLLSAVIRIPMDCWNLYPNEYGMFVEIVNRNYEKLKDADYVDILKINKFISK